MCNVEHILTSLLNDQNELFHGYLLMYLGQYSMTKELFWSCDAGCFPLGRCGLLTVKWTMWDQLGAGLLKYWSCCTLSSLRFKSAICHDICNYAYVFSCAL